MDNLRSLRIVGFLGPREAHSRSVGSPGWRIDGFNGISGLLAHPSIQTRHRLGLLGVDMELFERCVASEYAALRSADVVVIDEIGIISGWSKNFRKFTETALESSTPTVAVVRQKPGEFSDRVKLRNDVVLWTATRDNRETISSDIEDWIMAFG